ncbi:MAG: methyltransferase domain-containing protein [Gammaproteobacteria bacterium]
MIGIHQDDQSLLRCPKCHGALEFSGRCSEWLENGVFSCKQKNHLWRVRGGVADLADRSDFTLRDRFLDTLFDFLAPVHDLSVDHLLPVLQYPDPDAAREHYIDEMQLDGRDLQKGKEVKRILDVGAGPGANIPLIRKTIPEEVKYNLWALDLNSSMLSKFANNHRSAGGERIRLLGADGQALPLADNSFDRVLNVGGINLYPDPKKGLAEMARVAKKNTPIVVVDEGLDKDRKHSLLHEIVFKWLTLVDKIDKAPEGLLPDGCEVVKVFNVSRFYYCFVYMKTDHSALKDSLKGN